MLHFLDLLYVDMLRSKCVFSNGNGMLRCDVGFYDEERKSENGFTTFWERLVAESEKSC